MKKQMRCLLVAGLLLLAGLEGYGQACPEPMERVYADDETNDNALLGTPVSNTGLAVDGNLTTRSDITPPLLGLLGATYQEVRFTGSDQPQAGDAVYIKFGVSSSLLTLIPAVDIQAYNDGSAVGNPVQLNTLLTLLNGEDQQEIVFTPDVAFDAVRITAGGVASVGIIYHIYEAYFHKQVSDPITCDQPLDVLWGSDGSLASGLNGVENPSYAHDGDYGTSAVLKANASLLNKTHLTALYPTLSQKGDSIRLVIQYTGSELLNATVLANNFTIRTYNDNTPNQPIDLNSSFLKLSLLSGSSDIQVLTYPVTEPFNRIEISLGEGLAVALSSLNVYEIGRIAPKPIVSDLSNDSLFICEDALPILTINSPETCATYHWFETSTGGTEITGSVSSKGTSFAPVGLAVGTHKFYVSLTRYGCSNEASERTKVTVVVNEKPDLPTITLTALE